jgi:hypothetical protein
MPAISKALFNLAQVLFEDEHLVVLRNASGFNRLLRKDDLLDDGVAAVFGLAGGTVELLGLCFHPRRFTSDKTKEWLTERRVSLSANAPIMKNGRCPDGEAAGRVGPAAAGEGTKGG